MSARAGELERLETLARGKESKVRSTSSRHEALELSIAATELYMKSLRLAQTDDDRRRLKGRCRHRLEQAELIKAARDEESDIWMRSEAPPVATAQSEGLLGPQSSRELSTKEKILLLESSKLNGFVFPPWKEPPRPWEFDLDSSGEAFLDAPELGLSKLQLEIFDGWKRPMDFFPACSPSERVKEDGLTMTTSTSIDLLQDFVTDCSLVASLCAAIASSERGHVKSTACDIYPYDEMLQRPIVSRNGKYVFRMNFNGCFRRVVIDDRLPSSRTGRVLHVVDRNKPGLLWPALVEKAYLKIRGGYDFPGSNSGTDLSVLTGWIPEQVFLHSDDVMLDQLWRRISDAFGLGDVLVTIGTGRLTKREEHELGLAGEHDYAILQMTECGEHRRMLVKNPWSEGTVWKGGVQPDPSAANDGDGFSLANDASSIQRLKPGTFWIDIHGVLQNFESIYLNWNPALFRHRQDIHISWDVSTVGPTGCFRGNPQFAVRSEGGGTLWLLLNRHFRNKQVSPDQPTTERKNPGYISLYVFLQDGRRVFLSDGALHRGPFVDSPNTLARLEPGEGTTYTVVVAEQSLSPSPHAFTISTFSQNPSTIEPARERYPHMSTHHGSWTSSTAGGNASSPLYSTNPQFSLSISAPSDLALLLETSSPSISTHVKLVWSDGGKRITGVSARDIAGESGEYRRGCALVTLRDVATGGYTIIVSTFEAGQLGDFALRAYSQTPCVITPLPAEGAGRLRTTPPLAVFPSGVNRLLAPMSVPRLTRLRCLASTSPSSSIPSSPIVLSLELAQGPNKTTLTTTGGGTHLDASHAALRTPDVDIAPAMALRGGAWLVVERLAGAGAGGEEGVRVEVLSEGPVEIGPWGMGEG